jgi:hypothetical protein
VVGVHLQALVQVVRAIAEWEAVGIPLVVVALVVGVVVEDVEAADVGAVDVEEIE